MNTLFLQNSIVLAAFFYSFRLLLIKISKGKIFNSTQQIFTQRNRKYKAIVQATIIGFGCSIIDDTLIVTSSDLK